MTVLQAPEAPGQAPAPGKGGKVSSGLLDPKQLVTSLPDALRKLNPVTLWRNPVMLVVEVGAAFTRRAVSRTGGRDRRRSSGTASARRNCGRVTMSWSRRER
nr:hypothetical protein [Microbispora rosea]